MQGKYKLLVVTLLVSATGCLSQGQGGPSQVPVSGTVTLDGKPLPSGVLNLTAEQEGRASYGEIKNGTYNIDETIGPNLGKYRVQIYSYEPIPGAKVNESGDIPTRQIIPKKYNVESDLIVEFTSGKNVQDFELSSQK